MNQQGTTLTQIADRYGISTQTLRRRIDQHPELGIKVVPRKRTTLDANQTAALCGILDKLYATDDPAPATVAAHEQRAATARTSYPAGHAGHSKRGNNPAEYDEKLAAALQRIAELEVSNSDLLTEKHRLETDIAVANARADERGERISSLERRADEYPKLLKAGKDEARAAGLTEGKVQGREEGLEEGREAGIAEERERWKNMSRWKRFFAK